MWADIISWQLEISTPRKQLNLFAFAIQSWLQIYHEKKNQNKY